MQIPPLSGKVGRVAGTWGWEMLPVLAALLLTALERQQAIDNSGWATFFEQLGMVGLAGIPLLIAQFIAVRSGTPIALLVWLAGFVGYPLALQTIAGEGLALATRNWLIAAAFSALSLLTGGGGRERLLSAVRRLPFTLDGAIVAALALWALVAASLFASTADAVNNQPLRVWFNAARIAKHPLEFTSYLAQFAVVGGLLFAFYWICRYILVRKVLAKRGWIAFAQASLSCWIVYTPVACSFILLLPLNPPHWSLLPSENHNPFDPLNYGTVLIFWAIVMPLVLAGERLLAERSAAIQRHEQIRAELKGLHQQINPHFLFNALNTLYALCLKNHSDSADAVVKLSDLLRYAVYEGQNDWVKLEDEIAYLTNYIDLQLLRFGSRCRVSCRWTEDTSRFEIPPLVLIMLLENAFKHGVEPTEDSSRIEIDLSTANGQMIFTCLNTPRALGPVSSTPGLGLDNLRRRLELRFGARFSLSSAPQGDSWRAELVLWLRPC